MVLCMLCDRCDTGWHTHCLQPPLSKVPEDDRFCPNCRDPSRLPAAHAASAKATRALRLPLEVLKAVADGCES